SAAGRRAGRRRREDHLQLLRIPPARPPGGDSPHLEPGRRPALRAVLLPELTPAGPPARVTLSVGARPSTNVMTSLDLDRAAETFAEAADFTVGVEEEFSILHPETLDLVPRFDELRAAADDDRLLAESITGELIASEIEIISGI